MNPNSRSQFASGAPGDKTKYIEVDVPEDGGVRRGGKPKSFRVLREGRVERGLRRKSDYENVGEEALITRHRKAATNYVDVEDTGQFEYNMDGSVKRTAAVEEFLKPHATSLKIRQRMPRTNPNLRRGGYVSSAYDIPAELRVKRSWGFSGGSGPSVLPSF